jgi:hypothetical protein
VYFLVINKGKMPIPGPTYPHNNKAWPAKVRHLKNATNPATPEGSFLKEFLRLWEKLAPTLVLDLALFTPRREVGAYASFKKLASGANPTIAGYNASAA